jgi:2-polyprenyl-3-methyl-5-hydroxy-6-metoxy-1,4-benzoquinol methylase
MPSRHCCIVDQKFDERTAHRELRRYHRRGPATPTRQLLTLIAPLLPSQATLLDVGGGIGTIHHELLDRAAARAVQVDASSAYLAVARTEAARRGHADRVELQHADLRAVAPSLQPADVVTLDRVVCCDPDFASLLAIAAGHARTFLAFSYPRPRWIVRLLVAFGNGWMRLRGLAFRAYVHSPPAMAAVLERAGLHRRVVGGTWIWAVEVFERAR